MGSKVIEPQAKRMMAILRLIVEFGISDEGWKKLEMITRLDKTVLDVSFFDTLLRDPEIHN